MDVWYIYNMDALGLDGRVVGPAGPSTGRRSRRISPAVSRRAAVVRHNFGWLGRVECDCGVVGIERGPLRVLVDTASSTHTHVIVQPSATAPVSKLPIKPRSTHQIEPDGPEFDRFGLNMGQSQSNVDPCTPIHPLELHALAPDWTPPLALAEIAPPAFMFTETSI